jgi:5'(3')-deoxyribonucleotidase
MKKLIIAVDLDDVVVGSAQRIIDAYNEVYGTELDLSYVYSEEDSKKIWHAPDETTAIKRVYKFLESDEFYQAEPTQHAIAALQKLKQKYELFAVTGRHGAMEEATRMWLKEHMPEIFTDIIFTSFYNADDMYKKITKAEVCDELGASILVEDLPRHAMDVAASGKQVLLFGDYPWNQLAKLPPNMTRVADWDDVLKELM